MLIIVVCFSGCKKSEVNVADIEDEMNWQEQDSASAGKSNDSMKNPYFFENFTESVYYDAKYSFSDRKELPNSIALKVTQIEKLSHGTLYEMKLDYDKDFQGRDYFGWDRFHLGYFYVQEDSIYLLRNIEVSEMIENEDAIINQGELICSNESVDDTLGEEQQGWHTYIVTEGNQCEYHSYNNETETGFYETFVWEQGKGLVLYRSGFGAESDAIEIQLVQESTLFEEENSQEFAPIVTEFVDESQNTVSLGDFSFNIYDYHIEKKTEGNDCVTYEFKPNSDSQLERQEELTISIHNYESAEFPEREEAIDYLSSLVDYSKIKCYEKIKAESGIKSIYTASNGKKAVYLINVSEQYYLLEADGDSWDYNMLDYDIRQCLAYEHNQAMVECAQDKTYTVKKDMYYSDCRATYELYTEENKLYQTISMEIVEGEERCYKCQGSVYDAFDNQMHSFEWEVGREDDYPVIEDLNLDGYPDMSVLENSYYLNEGYALYTWNPENQSYEKVICEELLESYEICDGYIRNWIRSDGEGFIYQVLYWEGNTLVKKEESIVAPDPE